MAKPKRAVEKKLLKAWIELELRARLDLELHSDLEGRVPLGRYSRFVEERLREYFNWEQLDLGAYGLPAGYFIKGPKDMIAALRLHLAKAKPPEPLVGVGG